MLWRKEMNRVILHIEGLAVLVLSLYFYSSLHFSWLLFFVLLFVPDFSMFSYFINQKVDAFIYNIFHTYSLPIAIILSGKLLSQSMILAIGLIWLAHIGMDRMLGYGLKYPTNFKETHFSRI